MSTQPTTSTTNNTEKNVALEIATQIGEKKPPTNQQISEMIDKTQQFIEEKKNDSAVSQQSIKVLSDFQGVLEATEQFNKNKNADESLQKVIMETGAAGKDLTQVGKQAWNQQDKDLAKQKGQEARQQGKQLTQTIWSVLKEMIQSAEFRQQISSLLNVFQEILLRVNPSSLLNDNNNQQQQQHSTTQQQLGAQPSTTPTEQQHPTTTSTEQQQSKGKLSEESKREISHQFLLVLRRFNQNEEFRNGLRELIDVFRGLTKEYSDQTPSTSQVDAASTSEKKKKMPEEVKQVKQAFQENEHIDTAFEESKKIVEKFSKKPIDPLLQKNKALFQYVRTHPKIRDWFDHMTSFLKEALKNPHQLDEYEFTKKVDGLIDEGDSIANDAELRGKFQEVRDELKTILDAIRDDPDLKLLQERSSAFLDNFTTMGPDGQRKFNTDLMKELQTFIVPLLISQLDRIPLPPFSGSNEDYDYSFDNMVLYGQEILPDMVKFHAQTDVEFNVRQLSTHQALSVISIEIANVKAKVEDIHFKFTKKTFPHLTDEGIANIRVEGDQGFSLKIKLTVSNEQGAPHFHLNQVDADIQRLKIDIVEAKHDFLLKIFSSIYQTRVKLMVQQNIEQKVREVFAKIEQGMNNAFARFPISKLTGSVSQKATDVLLNRKSPQGQEGEQQNITQSTKPQQTPTTQEASHQLA